MQDILCRSANVPTTWQADAIIDAKIFSLLPELWANHPWHVTVSYFDRILVQDQAKVFFCLESE